MADNINKEYKVGEAKSGAPFTENPLPPCKIPQWKDCSTLSFPPNPSTEKIPLKTFVYLPISSAICKQWAKLTNCTPSPGVCGGLSHPQRHSY